MQVRNGAKPGLQRFLAPGVSPALSEGKAGSYQLDSSAGQLVLLEDFALLRRDRDMLLGRASAQIKAWMAY